MDFLIQVLVTLAVFTVVDLIWLTKVSPKLYRRHLGHLMSEKVNKIAALLFYVIFIVGLVFFVIHPHLRHLWTGVFHGAMFGLVTYATYDLTNLATLKRWSIRITVIDLCWGTFVTALTSGIVILILGGV